MPTTYLVTHSSEVQRSSVVNSRRLVVVVVPSAARTATGASITRMATPPICGGVVRRWRLHRRSLSRSLVPVDIDR